MDTTSSTSFATADTAAGTPVGPTPTGTLTPTVASNGMDFFFTEAPDQLLGATELDIQLSPLLQDRIAQLCLAKMRQASSGRESLQRLARLSCFWRRLQAEVLLMPMFTAPQVPAPLDQWLAEFAALEPSTPPLQGSTDFNWGLDLLTPPPGGLGLELDLWNMESVPQDLASMGALPFPFSVQPSAPSPFLDSSSNLQTYGAKPVPFEESLTPPTMNSTVIAAQEVGTPAIEAEIPVSSSYSSIPAYVVQEQPSVLGPATEAAVSDPITYDQPLQDEDIESPSSDMDVDVDLPIENMALSSPPPSPSKRRVSTTRKSTSAQRRTRKSNRVIRQSRKTKKEPESFTARLASIMQEGGEELEQASRIKRRRGSEDSSSSDSSPESAPASPRTPPSTYDGPSTPSSTSQSLYHLDSTCSKDAGPSKTSTERLSTVDCQDPSGKTSHHVVAVESLVNLKRMEEEGEPEVHSTLPLTQFPTRRPSTRAFSRS
ncbi:hypothetical protein BGZ58_002688 [Dissophora ornata]|nr:hypothetical protein BGZ58_002688 [Dissophora ornata]